MKWMLALLLAGMLLFAGCPQEEEAPVEPEEEEEEPYVPPPEPVAEPEVVQVGFVGPLTGERSAEGWEALNALELAATELSDNLYAYEVIEQDGKCTSGGAAEALEYLVDFRGVDVVIGGVCPEEVDGMAPLLAGKGSILLALSKGSADNDYLMNFAGTSDSSGDVLAEFCKGQGLLRTMVVTDGSEEALAEKGLFDASAKRLGLSTQPAQRYDSNFAATASVIKGYQPEVVIVLVSDGETAAQVVNALRSSGVNSRVLGGTALVSQNAISGMGANSEGVYALVSEFDEEEPAAAYFMSRYVSAYGPPENAGLVGDARNAFYLFAQAEDFYGYRATAQDLKNYWMSLDSWVGAGGTLTFENGDRQSSFRVVEVIGGTLVSVP